MRLLLDTHVAIWAVAYSADLPNSIRDLISDQRNEVFVSVVSIWEIALKHAIGRRSAPPFSAMVATRYFRASGYTFLHVTLEHVLGLEDLPAIHSDPFDRLLVAQSLAEPLRLVTHDPKIGAYSDTIIQF